MSLVIALNFWRSEQVDFDQSISYKMTQDVEMKELPAPSNSVTSTTPSPLQRKNVWKFSFFEGFINKWWIVYGNWGFSDLKEIASLIEAGAYAREVRRILRAVRLTIALRKKLKASVISQFLSFVLVPGSEVHSRLSSYLPKVCNFWAHWVLNTLIDDLQHLPEFVWFFCAFCLKMWAFV